MIAFDLTNQITSWMENNIQFIRTILTGYYNEGVNYSNKRGFTIKSQLVATKCHL